MTSGRRGERQTAYQILVASSLKLLGQEKGDLWDSGKVETNQSSQVEYAGQPLVSREDCFWKVRLWDGEGRAGGWSAAERWQIGLLKPGDWSAQWIWAGTPATAAIPYLRKSFDLKWPIKRAVLYTTALGLYEAHINGQRVGDHILAPDWTDYRERVRYQAYDVSALLKRGHNAMGTLLANGWFSGHIGNGGYQFFGNVLWHSMLNRWPGCGFPC
jgi:alpha-L-rhamnosidase